MARKFGMVFAAMVAIVVGLGTLVAQDKNPTTKEIMKKVAGKEGLCAKCNMAAKGGQWENAQKLGTQLKECGAALAKAPCPKGDAKSWEKLTKQYAEQTVAISKAADAKDAKSFEASIKTFTSSCKACHDAHK